MDDQTFNLREYPQVVELVAVLEQGGLYKEREDAVSLVDYIDNAEKMLLQMTDEIQELCGKAQLIRNCEIRSGCNRLLNKARDKAEQARIMVWVTGKSVSQNAGRVVQMVEMSGQSILLQAVQSLNILTALSYLKGGFYLVARAMGEAAGEIKLRLEQAGEIWLCKKDTDHTLVKKSVGETVQMLEYDRNILIAARELLVRLETIVSDLQRRAEILEEKVLSDR